MKEFPVIMIVAALTQGCVMFGPADALLIVTGQLKSSESCQLQLQGRENNIIDSRAISGKFDVTFIYDANFTRPPFTLSLACGSAEAERVGPAEVRSHVELGVIQSSRRDK